MAGYRKLGRTSSQRKALLRNQVTNLLYHGKIVTTEALEYSDGYIKIPDKPGLGIEINEEECALHPYKPHTLRHYTGALTDIRPPKSEFYF